MHVCVHVCVRTCMCACVHVCMCACVMNVCAHTHNEVQLRLGLEGIVQGDQEGEIPDCLQDAAFGERVLHHFPLLDDGGLLQDLHGKQLPLVHVTHLAHQEHLAIAWGDREGQVTQQIKGRPACMCPPAPPTSSLSYQHHLLIKIPNQFVGW